MKWWLPIVSALFMAGHLLVAVVVLFVLTMAHHRLTRMFASRKSGSS